MTKLLLASSLLLLEMPLLSNSFLVGSNYKDKKYNNNKHLGKVLVNEVSPLLVRTRTRGPAVSIGPTRFHKSRTSGLHMTRLNGSNNNNINDSIDDKDGDILHQPMINDRRSYESLFHDRRRNVLFSMLMIMCGAVLGPFLDSYHSAFGVLQYDYPISLVLWGSSEANPALITAWWVPELFGLAGFIIGWLYIILDHVFLVRTMNNEEELPSRTGTVSPPLILYGISLFTSQYWLSGALSAMGNSRALIFNIMSFVAAIGFVVLDGTWSGFLTSTATAIGGPLIEVGLISTLHQYHYTDSGELGFFPLWIIPVYFLGGPANGNLARGFWNMLSSSESSESSSISKMRPSIGKLKSSPSTATNPSSPTTPPGCKSCNDSRCVECPNCDNASGYYITYGQQVKCNACKGRGLVMCRACFNYYGEDPADIDKIRNFMSQIPD